MLETDNFEVLLDVALELAITGYCKPIFYISVVLDGFRDKSLRAQVVFLVHRYL